MGEDDEAMRIKLIENINAYGQILLYVMWCENNNQIAVINKTLCHAERVCEREKKTGKNEFSASAGHHRQ